MTTRAATTRLTGHEPVMQRLDWAMPAPPVERAVTVIGPDGGSQRPPILFVHGAAHGAWCWAEHWMPEAAARGWSTYAVDLRGHGDSGGRDRLRTTPVRHYVHDVLQTIGELPEPPILVGHSLGALVVAYALERYPARAGVLVSPPDVRHGLGIATGLLRRRPAAALGLVAGRPLALDADLLFHALDDATAAGYEARLGDESVVAELQLVLPRRPRPSKTPVLVLGAGEDRVIPPVDAVRTARHYGTRAHLFRGMGHDLMLDADWKAPLDVMLGWLEDTVASR